MRFPVHYPLICLALGAGSVLAQGVYRHVGPDGRVTFSDQPPASTAPAVPAAPGAAPVSGASGTELPFALRQVAQRYPVTLYTTTVCAPCDQGREMLRTRGIPFREKTVGSNEDLEAFQKLTGGSQLPHLTIGTQPLRGYSPEQWAQYLDAAGYPKASALPRNYRAPAPTALVPVAPPTEPAPTQPAAAAPAPAPLPVQPSGPSPQNPAGIRF